MKKMLVMVVACVAGMAAMAASPLRVTGTVATAGTNFEIPVSTSVGFRLENVVFGATAATTQTVSVVAGSVTNQLGTKVVSATDRMLTITNAPWVFSGDVIRVTTSATNAYPALLVGTTED